MSLATIAKNNPQILAKENQSILREQWQKESGLYPMSLKSLHNSYEEPSIFHQSTALGRTEWALSIY